MDDVQPLLGDLGEQPALGGRVIVGGRAHRRTVPTAGPRARRRQRAAAKRPRAGALSCYRGHARG
jgi:hypothetical protein